MAIQNIIYEVPEKIWNDVSITHGARRLYLLMLNSRTLENFDFDMSNTEIGQYFNVSNQCASNYVNELIRAGYIELVSFDGRKRVLRIKEE